MAPHSKERTADLFLMSAVFLVSAVFLMLALQLPPSRFDPLGPGSFPISICLLLMACSGFGVAKLLAGRSLGRAETSLIVGIGEETEHARNPWLAVALLALAFAYAVVLQFTPFGFSIATALFVILGSVVMSRNIAMRTILVSAVVGVGASAVLTFIFSRLLLVALP
jgi:hypothetical protein